MVVAQIDVFTLPGQVDGAPLGKSTAIVVDILRASTCIVTALAHGANCVRPCVSIEEAQRQAAELPGSAILGGERGGVPIQGFSLGNSPAEYESSAVAGKDVIITTTNGTTAIAQCETSQRVYIGAFANLSATCETVAQSPRVAIVCAGTDGHPTSEDLLFAGCLIVELEKRRRYKLSTNAQASREMWNSARRQIQQGCSLYQLLCESQGGQNLLKLGYEKDIEFSAEIDRFQVVARWDQSGGQIVAV